MARTAHLITAGTIVTLVFGYALGSAVLGFGAGVLAALAIAFVTLLFDLGGDAGPG